MLYFFWNQHAVWSLLALMFVMLGLWLLPAYRYIWDIDRLPLLQLLRQAPQKIVWVYGVVTQRMPFGFQIQQNGLLYFKLDNKDEITVSLAAKDLKLVSRTLNRILPRTSFGYSEEKAQIYASDPTQLLHHKDKPSI